MRHTLVVHLTELISGDDEYVEITGRQYMYLETQPNLESTQCLSSCAVIGVPYEMTREEILAFCEPYGPDILKYTVINDIDLSGFKTVVLDFATKEPMESFSRLYCNLHFPSYPNSPPCLVVSLVDAISLPNPSTVSPIGTPAPDSHEGPQATLHLEEKSSSSHTSIALSSSYAGVELLPRYRDIPDTEPEADSKHDSLCLPLPPPPAALQPIHVTCTHSNECKGGSSPRVDSIGIDANTATEDPHANLMSPPPPPRLRLPNCPLCLRRIKSCVSGVAGADAIIVGPDFSGNGDRCPVCFVCSEEGEAKRVCGVCGLHENLWACLQCGYVGCGRYTAQHAKKHFHNEGHPFSLEIVSQRIWDYVNDTFVHVDPFALFSQTLADMDASPNHRGNVPLVLQSAAGRSGANFLSSTSGSGVEQVERSPTAWVVEKPVDMMDSRRDYIMQHLDSAVVDKLSYLQTDYERLLEQQLMDQRLHYEKLIARETVRLLEMGIRVQNGQVVATGAEARLEATELALGGMDDVEADEVSRTQADRVAADLEIIENLKLEISALEYDYSETLQKIRMEEKETLSARKENDRLLKDQNQMKQRVAECTARIEEITWQEKEQTASLDQQIRDIEFYIRTQKEINRSPLRNEVQQGVVIVQGSATSSRSSTGSGGTRGNGKKKKAK